ncbi:MAG TPA: DNA methyltransferase, partial [Myxococcota bacterium]|nr:DNA methyltransferase [Myxococcota bacterium]
SDVAAGRAIVELKRRSREAPGRVHTLERGPELAPVHALDGQQLLSYARNVAVIDGVATASRPLTNVWDDVAWEGIAGEGGVQLKQGKKPERLLRRVLELTTRPGDRVLDPFAGSGTTGAVAHKIGRRYVLMESDARCATHVVPRLVRVVDGDDHTGISEEVGWRGGGGFCVYGAPDHAPFTGPGWR